GLKLARLSQLGNQDNDVADSRGDEEDNNDLSGLSDSDLIERLRQVALEYGFQVPPGIEDLQEAVEAFIQAHQKLADNHEGVVAMSRSAQISENIHRRMAARIDDIARALANERIDSVAKRLSQAGKKGKR